MPPPAYHAHPPVPKTDKVSHTHRIAHLQANNPLYIWGPFTSDMSRQVYDALLDDEHRPLCLVGSGSAVCYLIDAVQEYIKIGRDSGRAVHVLYTCRDAALFRYVVRVFERLLISPSIVNGSLANLEIVLGLTDDHGRLKDENVPVFESERDTMPERLASGSPQRFAYAATTAKNVNKFASALKARLAAKEQDGGGDIIEDVENFDVSSNQDGGGDIIEDVENFDVSSNQKAQEIPLLDHVLKLKYGRISFVDVLPKHSLIFVQVCCVLVSRVRSRPVLSRAHVRHMCAPGPTRLLQHICWLSCVCRERGPCRRWS